MQIRTLCSMIVGAGVVSFAISGCVPIKLLSENPQNARVTVSPRDAVVQAGQTQQFLAIVFGSSNTAVNWSVNGVLGGSAAVGTITDTGLYTSPSKINDWMVVSILAVLQANPSSPPRPTSRFSSRELEPRIRRVNPYRLNWVLPAGMRAT